MTHMAQVNLHIGNNLCMLQNKYFVKYFLEEMNFDLKEDKAKVCPISAICFIQYFQLTETKARLSLSRDVSKSS